MNGLFILAMVASYIITAAWFLNRTTRTIPFATRKQHRNLVKRHDSQVLGYPTGFL